MPLNFPSSPGFNQTHSIGDRVWRWNGTAWQYVPTSGSGGGGGGGANSFLASDIAPSTPISGDLWLNTLDGTLYIYYTDVDTSQWVEFTGSGYQPSILETLQTIQSSYTVTSNYNALSVGPVEVGAGCSVTVPVNSTWMVL